MTSAQERRNQLGATGGDVVRTRVVEGHLVGIVAFANRGKMNDARRALVRQGWHVVTNGVEATVSAPVE